MIEMADSSTADTQLSSQMKKPGEIIEKVKEPENTSWINQALYC